MAVYTLNLKDGHDLRITIVNIRGLLSKKHDRLFSTTEVVREALENLQQQLEREVVAR